MQIQLTSDDRPTLWQVLEGYLDDIRRKIAGTLRRRKPFPTCSEGAIAAPRAARTSTPRGIDDTVP
jgi:hypothetical protein